MALTKSEFATYTFSEKKVNKEQRTTPQKFEARSYEQATRIADAIKAPLSHGELRSSSGKLLAFKDGLLPWVRAGI